MFDNLIFEMNKNDIQVSDLSNLLGISESKVKDKLYRQGVMIDAVEGKVTADFYVSEMCKIKTLFPDVKSYDYLFNCKKVTNHIGGVQEKLSDIYVSQENAFGAIILIEDAFQEILFDIDKRNREKIQAIINMMQQSLKEIDESSTTVENMLKTLKRGTEDDQ